MRQTLDLHHYCSAHFELVPYSFGVVAAIVKRFLSLAAVLAAAAADACYLLVMAMVVTRIEYVAFEPVVVSTAYGRIKKIIKFFTIIRSFGLGHTFR